MKQDNFKANMYWQGVKNTIDQHYVKKRRILIFWSSLFSLMFIIVSIYFFQSPNKSRNSSTQFSRKTNPSITFNASDSLAKKINSANSEVIKKALLAKENLFKYNEANVFSQNISTSSIELDYLNSNENTNHQIISWHDSVTSENINETNKERIYNPMSRISLLPFTLLTKPGTINATYPYAEYKNLLKFNNYKFYTSLSITYDYSSNSISNNPSTSNRKNQFESGTFCLGYQFLLGYKFNRLFIESGLWFHAIGEKLNYPLWIEQQQIVNQNFWFANTNTSISYDTIYNRGLKNILTETVITKDSLLISYSDTIKSLVLDSTALNTNGINKINLISIPIYAGYEFRFNKFIVAPTLALFISKLNTSNTNYPQYNSNELEANRQTNYFKNYSFNYSVGLRLEYLISYKFSLYLQPRFHSSFSTLTNEMANEKIYYRNYGFNSGLIIRY